MGCRNPEERETCVSHQLHHQGILWTTDHLKPDNMQFSITWVQLPFLSTAVSSILQYWMILSMLRGTESWLQHRCEMGEWLCLHTCSHWVWSAVKPQHTGSITQCSALSPVRCGLLLLLQGLQCAALLFRPKGLLQYVFRECERDSDLQSEFEYIAKESVFSEKSSSDEQREKQPLPASWGGVTCADQSIFCLGIPDQAQKT